MDLVNQYASWAITLVTRRAAPLTKCHSLEGRLLFAVPKSMYVQHPSPHQNLTCASEGRLQQATLDLLSGSDIQFRRETRLDIALVKNLNIALIFLPAADIPTFVGEGRVDLGITGRDQVAEHDANLPNGEQSGVEELLDLGFGRCKLQVQVPEKGEMTKSEQLVGKNIVTSFTGLTQKYFEGLEGVSGPKSLKTKIKYVGGSVEAACALGVANGIVDLVGMTYYIVKGRPLCANTIRQNPAKQ
jgi:ATP phosphoribosyltransferase